MVTSLQIYFIEVSYNVKWIPCHHDMFRPVDGEIPHVSSVVVTN
jgi:hypothetical protein